MILGKDNDDVRGGKQQVIWPKMKQLACEQKAVLSEATRRHKN